MKCINPTCIKLNNGGVNMWQEHTKMYDRNHPENTHLVDNWHCSACGSVFTNKEVEDFEYEFAKNIDSKIDNWKETK